MNDNNRNYGYGRCSTNESKQDVEYQIKELVEKGVKKENIFFEYESGAKEDRPVFNKLLHGMVKVDSGIGILLFLKLNLVLDKYQFQKLYLIT